MSGHFPGAWATSCRRSLRERPKISIRWGICQFPN